MCETGRISEDSLHSPPGGFHAAPKPRLGRPSTRLRQSISPPIDLHMRALQCSAVRFNGRIGCRAGQPDRHCMTRTTRHNRQRRATVRHGQCHLHPMHFQALSCPAYALTVPMPCCPINSMSVPPVSASIGFSPPFDKLDLGLCQPAKG